MNRFLSLFFISFFILPLEAQRLHTPEDVVKIMEKSTVKYIFDSLTTKLSLPDYQLDGQLQSGLIRIEDLEGVKLEKSLPQYTKKQLKKIKKGDKSIRKKKYEKSRECYAAVYDLKSSETDIINKMANSYFKEKDYVTAIYWYEKSLEFNFIDTEARRNLAKCHSALGQIELAIDHITFAHLFNRNNPEIEKELVDIYKEGKLNYSTESFLPYYSVQQLEDKSVNVLYGHSVWAAYAAVVALWKYEPDYDESMKRLSNQKKDMIMKKEALMNALLTYERLPYQNKKEYFPLMHLLSEISLKKQIDNFVIYEIISKENPQYILSLENDKLEQLKNYLLVYRTGLE